MNNTNGDIQIDFSHEHSKQEPIVSRDVFLVKGLTPLIECCEARLWNGSISVGLTEVTWCIWAACMFIHRNNTALCENVGHYNFHSLYNTKRSEKSPMSPSFNQKHPGDVSLNNRWSSHDVFHWEPITPLAATRSKTFPPKHNARKMSN